MEDSNSKKRARVDSDSELNSDAPESKRNCLDSDINSDDVQEESTESHFNTSGADAVETDILNILEDGDGVDEEIQDLDLVIRSFEEEILQPAMQESTSVTDESQPDLGYLLEASDDELGLPPVTSPAENNQPKEDVPSYDSFELESELPSHDSYEFGFVEEYGVANEFVAVGGLFEYPEASDFAEFLWRPESESLPAV